MTPSSCVHLRTVPPLVHPLPSVFSMRRLKILLVEDDDDARALYGYMLASAGYKVKAVRNGLEALAEIQVNRPDVVVTDIAMPVLSGLDLIVAVKVVEDLKEAICHINDYGSHHSDAIITENYENAMEFLKQVDSACVYVNASTRFTDGHQFGMGAEIGISTDKLHARGPMALEELTTYKYMIFGDGQVRT